MENTLKNKAAFFAQYWEQKNITSPLYETKSTFMTHNLSSAYLKDYLLELKKISSITDEDSIYISNIVYGNDEVDKIEYGRKYILDYFIERSDEFTGYILEEIIIITDYLRSKGYALPYMGLSIEKQIEYGWIKLKENAKD